MIPNSQNGRASFRKLIWKGFRQPNLFMNPSDNNSTWPLQMFNFERLTPIRRDLSNFRQLFKESKLIDKEQYSLRRITLSTKVKGQIVPEQGVGLEKRVLPRFWKSVHVWWKRLLISRLLLPDLCDFVWCENTGGDVGVQNNVAAQHEGRLNFFFSLLQVIFLNIGG